MLLRFSAISLERHLVGEELDVDFFWSEWCWVVSPWMYFGSKKVRAGSAMSWAGIASHRLLGRRSRGRKHQSCWIICCGLDRSSLHSRFLLRVYPLQRPCCFVLSLEARLTPVACQIPVDLVEDENLWWWYSQTTGYFESFNCEQWLWVLIRVDN